jgi:hypothetical protein
VKFFIDGLVLADFSVGKSIGLLLGGKQLHILAQRSLVALQGENLIGLLFEYGLGDLTLTAHGINSDDCALNVQHFQKLGDGNDLVGLVRHLHLTQHQAVPGGEGGNHVDRRLSGVPVARTPHGLAIDCNHPSRDPDDRGHPCNEAALERIGSLRGWRPSGKSLQ